MLVHKNYDPKKIESQKFGQNWVSNSWDYADMDIKGVDKKNLIWILFW